MAPLSAPKMAKNTQPIMFATRSGTIVCVSRGATKKIAPARANRLARVMLCRKISSRPVEDRVPGDVAGVETQLDQDLGDPEIIGCRIQDAIQDAGLVCADEHTVSQGVGCT